MNKQYAVLLSPTTKRVSRREIDEQGYIVGFGKCDYVNKLGQKIWIDPKKKEQNDYYIYETGSCSYTEKIEKKLIEARKITFTKEVV